MGREIEFRYWNEIEEQDRAVGVLWGNSGGEILEIVRFNLYYWLLRYLESVVHFKGLLSQSAGGLGRLIAREEHYA